MMCSRVQDLFDQGRVSLQDWLTPCTGASSCSPKQKPGFCCCVVCKAMGIRKKDAPGPPGEIASTWSLPQVDLSLSCKQLIHRGRKNGHPLDSCGWTVLGPAGSRVPNSMVHTDRRFELGVHDRDWPHHHLQPNE